MVIKGRTVLALVVIAMLLSSLVTMAVADEHNPFSNIVKSYIGSKDGDAVKNGSDTSTKTPANVSPEEFNKLTQMYSLIKDRYVREVKGDVLINGAINGMVSALKDPYTSYMTPEISREFQSSLQSSFEGIGAEVTLQGGRVTIVSPFRSSPAEKAGLRSHDQIISVNGDKLEGMNLYDATMKIKGPKGTEARLEVIRPGISEVLKITVVRDKIPIETVYSDMLDNKIGKIEITSFSANTAEHFRNELKKLEDQGMKGLVVDVRDDPGGYLNAVIDILNELVPKNKTLLQVEDREGNRTKYPSKGDGAEYPIAVLMNKGSASASEILAGAMQDSYGAKLVGTNSFGKGTVQNTEVMKDGSSLKITIAKWLTPTGKWIHEKGIKPDFEVAQPSYFTVMPLKADKQLQLDMNSSDVKNLQIMLEGLGLNPGRKDGYFNVQTKLAVSSFQLQHKLPQTGIVDKKTAQLLQEQIVQHIRNPKNDLQLQKALQLVSQQIK